MEARSNKAELLDTFDSELSSTDQIDSELIDHVFEEATPPPFDFKATAREHGWVMLRPFEWVEDTVELSRLHLLESGQVVRLRMRAGDSLSDPVIRANVESAQALTPEEVQETRQAVRRMLRLDEDFSELYQLYRQFDGWNLRLRPGAGRLLRCPRLFEDIIYTLCTTNIAWSGTIRMVDRLVDKLGDSFPGRPEWRAFPMAAAIAAAGPEFLKEETGLGYRSAYVWELAVAVAEGRLDLAAFEDPGHPTETLHQSLRQIKGVGNYAAATILMLLGRYEHLAIDSELRAFVTKKYFEGQTPGEADIRAIYAPWGRWKYLAYWFDSIA